MFNCNKIYVIICFVWFYWGSLRARIFTLCSDSILLYLFVYNSAVAGPQPGWERRRNGNNQNTLENLKKLFVSSTVDFFRQYTTYFSSRNDLWSDKSALETIFHRVKELFKSNQTWYGVSPVKLECKTKRVFAIACLGKKKFLIRKIANFANNEFQHFYFWLGQEVVQFEPILAWSIPCLRRV